MLEAQAQPPPYTYTGATSNDPAIFHHRPVLQVPYARQTHGRQMRKLWKNPSATQTPMRHLLPPRIQMAGNRRQRQTPHIHYYLRSAATIPALSTLCRWHNTTRKQPKITRNDNRHSARAAEHRHGLNNRLLCLRQRTSLATVATILFQTSSTNVVCLTS